MVKVFFMDEHSISKWHQSLQIRRHDDLLNRFPTISQASKVERSTASWIMFAPHLPLKLVEQIYSLIPANDFTGKSELTRIKFNLVDAWMVGNYEVALINGERTEKLKSLLEQHQVDYADIAQCPDLSQPGLVVMDMDSTAIQIECIDEIAALAGVGEQVSALTERAMQGELDFEQSLRQRVATLAGANQQILAQVRANLPLTLDLENLVGTLHEYGWKVALASGGFTYFSEHLKQILSLDYAQANELEIIDERLTGQVLGAVVSAQTKANTLIKLAQEYQIKLSNTVAVGDGANDLPMMQAAGLGIAFHAKPKVEQQAQAAIRFAGLGGVLCILSAHLMMK